MCDHQLPELFSPHEWRALEKRLELTPRQGQIARLICLGLTNDQMATELCIATHTVRMHKQALFKRLNIQDRIGVPVRLTLANRRFMRRKQP